MNISLGKDAAIALAKTEWWKGKPAREVVQFQLFTEELCMGFGDFQKAVEEAFGRPVWTHEFADRERLQSEFLGEKESPTMQEIIEMIPADKRHVLKVL